MDANGILLIILLFAVVLALTPVLGGYMARIYDGRARWLAPVEQGI